MAIVAPYFCNSTLAYAEVQRGALRVDMFDLTAAPLMQGRIVLRRSGAVVAVSDKPSMYLKDLAFGEITVEVSSPGFQPSSVSFFHDQARSALPILLEIGMISGMEHLGAGISGKWGRRIGDADASRWIRLVPLFDGRVVTVSPDGSGHFSVRLPKIGRYLLIALQEGKICWQTEVLANFEGRSIQIPDRCSSAREK